MARQLSISSRASSSTFCRAAYHSDKRPVYVQTLSDEQFENALPALQTLLDKAGLLWILWLFLLLPLGFIIQVIGLLKEGIIPRWQAVVIIVGLLLLINPDIEIISSVGASLMCVGVIPAGLRELSGALG